jgi:hypothetical protein
MKEKSFLDAQQQQQQQQQQHALRPAPYQALPAGNDAPLAQPSAPHHAAQGTPDKARQC